MLDLAGVVGLSLRSVSLLRSIPRLVLKKGACLAALSGESSLDTHRSSFGLIDGLFDWVSDYVVKEDHLYGCEIAVRIEASARANMLIAGSIVRIHLLRRQCQLLDETNLIDISPTVSIPGRR